MKTQILKAFPTYSQKDKFLKTRYATMVTTRTSNNILAINYYEFPRTNLKTTILSGHGQRQNNSNKAMASFKSLDTDTVVTYLKRKCFLLPINKTKKDYQSTSKD